MVDATTFLSESEAMLTRLYQSAYCILHSRADAEDAVQQALMKAWAARERAHTDTFRAWLARIVINECRNIQRHRHRVYPAEEIPAPAAAYTPPDPDLAAAVQRLPDALRIPFILKYLVSFTEREVAAAMRLPVSTVKNRLHKARRLLREDLAEWEVTFE